MKKLYYLIFLLSSSLLYLKAGAQCSTFQATYEIYESRCAATGAIKITATGGSGDYKYKASGPVNINFTSTDSITGLSSGTYTIEVQDIITSCKIIINNVVVPGDYSDPRFLLSTDAVFCDDGSNGSIRVEDIENGRGPFLFSIVAPSASGVGTTNNTGVFNDLISGSYSIRLIDSCGGIQTRTISVENYTWKIDSYQFDKIGCERASGWIRVTDSRGNVSTSTGIPGMLYGLLVEPEDTVWSADPNFTFDVPVGTTDIKVFARDQCGVTKHITTSVFLFPKIDNNVTITNKSCSTFTATVTGQQNFFDPNFCLYDDEDNGIDCNDTGVFPDLPYGSYCIKATDACSDTIIVRCFTVDQPIAVIGDNVEITNKNCNTFDVSVMGQSNLFDPEYCLYDENDDVIECNETGVFTGIPYGSYCIKTQDKCSGLEFTNCFEVGQPQPRIVEIITPSYVNCNGFGIEVTGDSLYNPLFCLYNDLGIILDCNNTGIFDDVDLGSYCITVLDECTNITIKRCFTVGPPEALNDMIVTLSDQTCFTFTAHVETILHAGVEIFLYDSNDDLVGSSFDGIFENLPYGSYCAKLSPTCPDTTLITCFDAAVLMPQVLSSIKTQDKACNSFTAMIQGQKNLTDPDYYLTNETGDTLSSNKTGVFNNLAFGKYCILVKDNCYDTTIKLCVEELAPDFKLTVNASASCNYGTSKIKLSANTYPVTYAIYTPADILAYSGTMNSTVTIDGVPELDPGEEYKVVATDDCGVEDIKYVSTVTSHFTHNLSVLPKCPGGKWPNGSGDIKAVVQTNTGYPTVRIVKKNGVTLSPSWTPNTVMGGTDFIFQDMGPGTYIVGYKTADACKNEYTDTITIHDYQYPNLNRSSAYQCDVNGFSVGAVVSNGVGPFTYEIIGSTPDVPSIIAGPQSSPVFTIDNGYNYTLIRLRALDACGNATLGDASILPLANSGINVSENCLGLESVLSIDTVYNANVTWYYKQNMSDDDGTKVKVGEGFQLVIDPLGSDRLGYYIAELELNNGCITRIYGFNLNGDCHPVVPVIQVEVNGRYMSGKTELNWSIRNDADLQYMTVEKKDGNEFKSLGSVGIKDYTVPGQYRFTDVMPSEDDYYRIKLEFAGGKYLYSKIVHVTAPSDGKINVYPNPVADYFKIELNDAFDANGKWKVEMMNSMSQKTLFVKSITGRNHTIQRTADMTPGIYFIKLTNDRTGEMFTKKIILK